MEGISFLDSNTTLVKVKSPKLELSLSSLFDSNTTLVKVKLFLQEH